MDPALIQLLPQIKDALGRDACEAPGATTVSLEALLPAIREALNNGEVLSGADDAALAARVNELLPRLLDQLRRTYSDVRQHLASDFPWTLPPLEWGRFPYASRGLGK